MLLTKRFAATYSTHEKHIAARAMNQEKNMKTLAVGTILAVILSACGPDPADVEGKRYSLTVTVRKDTCASEPRTGEKERMTVTFNQGGTATVTASSSSITGARWGQSERVVNLSWSRPMDTYFTLNVIGNGTSLSGEGGLYGGSCSVDYNVTGTKL